jgi:MarR family transcriptional regulator for hemolysin
MEAEGLLLRRRNSDNRRVHQVELTSVGEEAFHRLRRAAVTFDQRLRRNLTGDDLQRLTDLLDRLQANIVD